MPLTLGAAILVCAAPVAIDGDTLRCAGAGRVRLVGIDAPELPGHCRPGRACTPGDAAASQRNLARLIRARRVTCERQGIDSLAGSSPGAPPAAWTCPARKCPAVSRSNAMAG